MADFSDRLADLACVMTAILSLIGTLAAFQVLNLYAGYEQFDEDDD